MVMYYAPPTFPFSKLFSLGVGLIVLGLLALALGVTDVVYTMVMFGPGDCKSPSEIACLYDPCVTNPSLPWVYAAPGVWTGFFTIVAGGVAAALLYSSGVTLKTKRDSTGVLAGLIAFPLGPATLVITALRLFYMNGIFYCVDTESQSPLTVVDYAQLLIPVIVGLSVLLAWCLALAIMVLLCQKGRLSQRDDFDDVYTRRYRGDYARSPYDSPPRGRRRPYVLPDPYERQDRPSRGYWTERPSWGRAYPPPARTEPYPTYANRYYDSYGPSRGYYTTRTYNRYY